VLTRLHPGAQVLQHVKMVAAREDEQQQQQQQ
jgi:hypothetical protein